MLNHAQTISQYQPLLQAIALKMVGSLHDAEDIVQDTFVKWLTIDQEKIENTKAYLIRTVTNNCLNHLNSFTKKKKEYISSLKTSEFFEKYKEFNFPNFDIENEISEALSILHKKLEPVEKGIFVLREVFDVDYEELQQIFGKKKENCRQMVLRAKAKLRKENHKSKEKINRQAQLLESFKQACSFGSLSEFIQHLTQEAEIGNRQYV